ncbi:MAG: type II secretion system F family protein [Ectothiorhodospiraceae bacterium AqS1]|nr:type II secretion system F family protein [Ectothiorhodospiraceae bacterium AqS1]
MPMMRYRAMDAQGAIRHGCIDVAGAKDLEARLERMGLDLIECRRVRRFARSLRFAFRSRGIPRRQLLHFYFHLEQLLSVSVPVPEALAELRDSAQGYRLREVLADMLEAIDAGAGLSQAMERHPRVFDSMMTSLVRAAESSGDLPTILRRITENLRWQDEQTRQFRKLLLPPLFMAFVVGAVIVFLMVYLVPRLVGFIEIMGQELPLHTRMLVALSAFVERWWRLMPLLALPALPIVILTRLFPDVHERIDALRLRLWPFGPLRRKFVLSRFAGCFALMYSAGIPVLESIRISEALLDNRALVSAAREAARQISQGASISEGFARTGFFPSLVLRMLRVGESTGGLDTALSKIAYFYERDVREAVERVQLLVTPLCTLFLGALLLWVVVSVMGPIYDMVAGIAF